MSKSRILFVVVFAVAVVGLARLVPLDAQGGAKATPTWIWFGASAQPDQTVYFRKEISLDYRVTSAKLYGACDNRMTVYINGKEVAATTSWEAPIFKEVTDAFVSPTKVGSPVRNVVTVKAHNVDGPAGMFLRIVMENSKKETTHLVTDASWRVTDRDEKEAHEVSFNDNTWKPATVVAKLGSAPWAKINETALQGIVKLKKPSATPVELIKVKKDFKVELLYSVPREKQGSWVSMCVDPKGRLITSDQYGKLYRVTPPPVGADVAIQVEELPVDLGEAHGLCWAFDSLYVVVNEGKKYKPRGLWRVTSSKNDDVLDKKEHLREIEGNGEHGPHAVMPGPDGKSLYVMCGNHTKLTKIRDSLVPKLWGEDFLVPRQWDASGHAVNIFAPGGYICKTDKDGKNWDLVSIGYRNQYDAAFNRDGELFTFDSDMEWDINMPWYKATRVCHAVEGSEFGWRSGTSNFPHFYPDNLPPTIDIGPGSPTGVCFGYGAKFPMKYQDALYCCDWSYGKLFAVHLKPNGASYTAEMEEFMNGSPLPLTDIVVNPKDGVMYFTIGGRTTMSGLYRVTYVGKESTAQPPIQERTVPPLVAARKKLESFYAKQDPKAAETAWPYLNHEDRFLRNAARSVLEFQDPRTWQEKALTEENSIARMHALLGLIRLGDKSLQPRILEALDRIDWAKLTTSQRIDLARCYQLAFIRLGDADAGTKTRVGKRLDAFYPSNDRDLNAELCKLISYLEVPGGIAKSLALVKKAPTQEEQIDYIFAMRTIKTGWTMQQRADYFDWFHLAATYRGGNSFQKFMANIRTEAINWSLSADEKASLKAVLAKVPVAKAPQFTFKQRPFVKKYSVEELVPAVEKGLTGRNYANGRNLFGEAKCFACHRFNNEGGGTGPDLTQVVGRFGPRDLLESLIEPSKVVSDQYAAIVVTTTDGRQIVGRVVNLAGDGMMINTDMLDPNKLTNVNRNLLESIEPSKISMMPEGLLDTLGRDDILDLVAYLYSRGDANHKMFRKE